MDKYFYAEAGELYANSYLEIYIPMDYFSGKYAINTGSTIKCLGLLYIRAYPNGKEGDIKLLNVPVWINISIHGSQLEEIRIHGKTIQVLTLKFSKGLHVMHQTIEQGRLVAEVFVDTVLSGKLPRTLDYGQLLDIWWKNLELSGIDYKIPSKIYEMILANIYRHPSNNKLRFGEYYGKQSSPDGYNYKTGNVRDVVEGLSTFSGMVFEDIGRMITSGINNSIEGIEEPVSPLEKIIHY